MNFSLKGLLGRRGRAQKEEVEKNLNCVVHSISWRSSV